MVGVGICETIAWLMSPTSAGEQGPADSFGKGWFVTCLSQCLCLSFPAVAVDDGSEVRLCRRFATATPEAKPRELTVRRQPGKPSETPISK